MSTDPYVRFYIENGVEVATMTAADFRAAMLERDAEIERLKVPEGHHQWIHFREAITCWCRKQPTYPT